MNKFNLAPTTEFNGNMSNQTDFRVLSKTSNGYTYTIKFPASLKVGHHVTHTYTSGSSVEALPTKGIYNIEGGSDWLYVYKSGASFAYYFDNTYAYNYSSGVESVAPYNLLYDNYIGSEINKIYTLELVTSSFTLAFTNANGEHWSYNASNIIVPIYLMRTA